MDLKELLSNSSILERNEVIVETINSMAINCNNHFNNQSIVVLPVMTGALTFAGHILPQLTMDLELSYIHATRYRNNIGQKQVEWFFQPEKEMIKDRIVLILDDILDQGITLDSIREKLLFLGAKKVFTAALFDKWIKSEKSIEADFVGLNIPDKYVFGFGLDFDGIGRNMPHLYAYNKGE